MNFPSLDRDTITSFKKSIDSTFREFASNWGEWFTELLSPIHWLLIHFEKLLFATPWYIFLGLISLLLWKATQNWKLILGFLISFILIGLVGMWDDTMRTLAIVLVSTLVCIVIGIPIGILSAVKRGSIWDAIGRTFAVFGQALPPFWLGIMLILIFSVNLDILPSGTRGEGTTGWTKISYFIMPAVTLGWLASAGLMRLVRSSMLEVLDSEFVKLARAKGANSKTIIWKHAFRNALIPPLTFAALIVAGFIAGTVVTETVFAWPGLGFMTFQAIINNDFPVMMAAVMVFTVIYVMTVFIVDILYAFIDPRIRHS